MAMESGAPTACDRLPKAGSSTSAIAGSPRKPMPSEAIVMPSWQADRYSSMWSICVSSRPARLRPSCCICSTRLSRVRTRENSAATKKALAATSRRTPSRNRNSVISDRGLSRGYFEEDRRRSFGGRRESSNSPSQLEVVGGQPALRVRRDRDGHLVPGDRQVGVVVHVLGLGREAVHEVHRALEVVELEGAPDRVAVTLPAVQLGQPLLDLLVVQTCHPRLHAHRIACALLDRDAV